MDEQILKKSQFVVLNRPGHSDLKRVTFEGFLLLEEAESSFGTSIQSIERIDTGLAWVSH